MAESSVLAAAGDDLLNRTAGRLARLDGWRRLLTAFALGAVAAGALPPFHVLPLLWPAFTGLLWLLDGVRRGRSAFFVAWSFASGYFAAGIYWVGIAFLVEAERFGAIMPFAVAGLAVGLGLVHGLAVLAVWRTGWRGIARVLALAAAWLVAEWLRTWLFTGFPWNPIGSVWTFSAVTLQLAAVTGIWGLSWITIIAAAAPAVAAENPSGPARRDRPGRRWAVLLGALVLRAVVGLGGAWRLAMALPAGSDVVAEVRLRLVQPNIDQRTKWLPERRAQHVTEQMELSRSPGYEAITHLIWAETAVPYVLANEPKLRETLATVVPEHGLLLTGALRGDRSNGSLRVWNSLYALDRQGTILATYDKQHLVPFGEYDPLNGAFGMTKLTQGNVGFSSGEGPFRLDLPGLPRLAALICYEAIFPGQVTDSDARPDWLLNVTNDAWFGDSTGPYQHLASARLRAVEEGLPLIRAANTGISAVIDGHGRILARLGLNERDVLDSPLPRPAANITPYAWLGNWVVLMLFALSLSFCLLLRRFC
jgi:apolipoprotein N-acyltransferase